MNLVGELLQTLSWQLKVFETGMGLRLRNLLSLVIVAASTGIAFGYALVSRGRADDDEEGEPGEGA